MLNVNEWCISKNHNFVWARANRDVLSLFCHPNPNLVASFSGQNSRPGNDLLLTEQIIKRVDISGLWEITCTKKHHFEVGFTVAVQHAGKSILECDVKQVVSDKAFCVKAPSEDSATELFQPDCDTTYVVKIIRRDPTESYYMSLKESLKSKSPFLADRRNSELKILHEKFLQLTQNQIKNSVATGSVDSILTKQMAGLLGNMVGCEVVSSMIYKNRLPLHQWVS